jgi:hypothetical protein
MKPVKYVDNYPDFAVKHTLKPRLLECVRDFPREMETLRYADYADGILFGCRVRANTAVTVSPGVILKGGVFYRMTAPVDIPYESGNDMQYLKVRFGGERGEDDISERSAEIVLEATPKGEIEMELARFRLKEGARLRSDYTGFDDLDTEFDTLCVLYSPCAAPGGGTLLPFVTSLFAEEALSRMPENPLDAGFAMLCLQGERVNPAVLRRYLGTDSADIHSLYTALSRKLASFGNSGNANTRKTIPLRKILVD